MMYERLALSFMAIQSNYQRDICAAHLQTQKTMISSRVTGSPCCLIGIEAHITPVVVVGGLLNMVSMNKPFIGLKLCVGRHAIGCGLRSSILVRLCVASSSSSSVSSSSASFSSSPSSLSSPSEPIFKYPDCKIFAARIQGPSAFLHVCSSAHEPPAAGVTVQALDILVHPGREIVSLPLIYVNENMWASVQFRLQVVAYGDSPLTHPLPIWLSQPFFPIRERTIAPTKCMPSSLYTPIDQVFGLTWREIDMLVHSGCHITTFKDLACIDTDKLQALGLGHLQPLCALAQKKFLSSILC